MPFVKCPTCRRLLANKYKFVRDQYDIINNNNSLKDIKKREMRSDVINSLGLTRRCCKAHVIGVIHTELYLK